MKIILIENTDKEGVINDSCFSWRHGYYLCICHETRHKEHITLINLIPIYAREQSLVFFILPC
jgi:hypothetical protein